MKIQPGFARYQDRRGFSAVEVIAVATIIAILAVILIPILSSQVDKSKDAAQTDELGQLARVITLTQAYTGKYFRLQDYDNSSNMDSETGNVNDPTTEVPVTYYGRTTQLPLAERIRLSKTWDGPRTVFHSYATVQDLYQSYKNAFTPILSPATTPLPTVLGPIYVFHDNNGIEDASPETLPTENERFDRYPVDQWGNPYLFFAPGSVVLPDGTTESIYSPVIYSLGRDGYPGTKITPDPVDYYPSQNPQDGRLGAKLDGVDDIKWEF